MIKARLQISINQLTNQIEAETTDIDSMYDQIRLMNANKRNDDAKSLASKVVGKEKYVQQMRTNLDFFEKQANQLRIDELASHLDKTMKGVNNHMDKQFNDTNGLQERLADNHVLIKRTEERRTDINALIKPDNNHAYEMGAVLKKAEDRASNNYPKSPY